MCRTLRFFMTLDRRTQPEYVAIFRRFLLVDVIYAVVQIFEYFAYKNIAGSFGFIFILCALLFIIDAGLLSWIISIPLDVKPQKHIVILNTISNVITLIFYTISKFYFVTDFTETAFSVVITMLLLLALIGIKGMKVYIIHRYLQFCDASEEQPFIPPKVEDEDTNDNENEANEPTATISKVDAQDPEMPV